jgi:1-acyl-sn-glycerol-3-phosphate acyltransferase
MKFGIVVRSCVFLVFQVLLTPPFAIFGLLTFPLPPLVRYRIIFTWSRLCVLAAWAICGVRYRVLGTAHMPSQPCVILAKHQSAWETMAFSMIFPPQAIVIKRELLWIPFFGWGMAMVSPISINRGSGLRALRQMLQQGKDRLQHGFWVTVFPEGTRMKPGERGQYRTGGAAIAVHAKVPVLPVAHNAGVCWPRNAFLKYPGTITVSIGPLISSQGLSAEALTQQVEAWIEAEMPRLDRAA